MIDRIDKEWSLFLDRDGVINEEIPGGYVLSRKDFRYMPGAREAIAQVSACFGRIIVVSNQKCVGKGLITPADLESLHEEMVREISRSGGRIDRVYYCPDLDQDSPCRKPHTGMGRQACRDFPEIDLSRTIMVGNKWSDMEFARELGVVSCLVTTTLTGVSLPDPRVDLSFPDLPATTRYLAGLSSFKDAGGLS